MKAHFPLLPSPSTPFQAARRAPRRRSALAATLKAVALAVALLTGGQAAWAQVYYNAQALPELQPQGPFGQGWTLGWALNDSGTVVGYTQSGSAVRWSFSEGLQNIGSPAGAAYGIANNGTAVGSLGGGPVRWSPTAGFAALSDVYAGAPTNGVAYAVNDQDWVLASDLTGQANNGLVLLRPGQAALNLGAGGASTTDIRFNPMINANGMVASTSRIAGQSFSEGLVWTEAGGARTFSAPGGGSTRLSGLNDNGLVVGESFGNGATSYGFIYNANTGTLLQSVPGFQPTDINNAGAIVGIQYGGNVPGGSSASAWRNGATVNLNRFTTDLGVYHLTQAVDINGSGQILAIGLVDPAKVPTNFSGPALRTFLLSECARCGQIKPNPNPASTLLVVGTDWIDAFNAEDYRNEGTLRIGTYVANVQGAFLRNGGDIEVLASPGRLYNTGSLENGPGGRIIVSGVLDTGGVGSVVNRASVRVLGGGSVFVGGSEGFVNRSLSSFTQVGGSVRNATLFSVEEALFDQQGGSFENLAGATFRMWGGDAVVGGSFANAGTVLMGPDPVAPIGSPSRPSQMRITGTLENQSGAVFTAEGDSLIEVTGGRLLNRGNLTLDSVASRLTLRGGGSLANDGGTLRLEPGSRLVVADDAGSLQQQSGRLFVARGARLEIGQTRGLDVFGGRVSNEGVIVARSGARITNSGSFQLQTGSRLELDGGSRFDQGAGELLVAAGASIVGSGLLDHSGGTTTVNGSVFLPMSVFTGGVLAGNGFISGTVVLAGAIDTRAGASPGTLTFLGDVDMADARIEVEVESHRIFDKIVVAGNLNIGQASVRLVPYAGYTPDLNDSLTWLSAGSMSGNALQIDTSLLPTGWRAVPGNGGGTFDLWNDAAVALGPNPNPAGALLSVAAGTLAHNSPGNGSFFDNLGTVEVAGSLANRPGATLVQQAGAKLNVLAGGRVSNRGSLGGGTIDNAGTLINYQDGEIYSGFAQGDDLVNRGRIENDGTMRVNQRFNNEASGVVINRGLMNMSGVSFDNQGRFENHGSVENFGFITNNNGEFVVAEGGTVSVDEFNFGWYRDVGGITQVDGRLQANLIELGGTLLGHGTLAGPVQLGGYVAPDVGTGLTIEGSVESSAVFFISWQGAGLYSRLSVTGDLNVPGGGTVFFVLSPDGYVPQAGDSVQWLSVDGSVQGLDSLDWYIVTQGADAACLACELGGWTPPDDLRVSFNGGVLSLQPVPEPGTWALLLFGLAGIGVLAHRRRQEQSL